MNAFGGGWRRLLVFPKAPLLPVENLTSTSSLPPCREYTSSPYNCFNHQEMYQLPGRQTNWSILSFEPDLFSQKP